MDVISYNYLEIWLCVDDRRALIIHGPDPAGACAFVSHFGVLETFIDVSCWLLAV